MSVIQDFLSHIKNLMEVTIIEKENLKSNSVWTIFKLKCQPAESEDESEEKPEETVKQNIPNPTKSQDMAETAKKDVKDDNIVDEYVNISLGKNDNSESPIGEDKEINKLQTQPIVKEYLMTSKFTHTTLWFFCVFVTVMTIAQYQFTKDCKGIRVKMLHIDAALMFVAAQFLVYGIVKEQPRLTGPWLVAMVWGTIYCEGSSVLDLVSYLDWKCCPDLAYVLCAGSVLILVMKTMLWILILAYYTETELNIHKLTSQLDQYLRDNE